MELTIRADGAEAAQSLRVALDGAGDFELSAVGESTVAVVAGAEDAPALAAALSGWLHSQPPGSEMTVETSTQVFTVHAGDPRAAVAVNEAVTRESRTARDDAGRDDAGRDDAGRDDAGRDDAARDDEARDDGDMPPDFR